MTGTFDLFRPVLLGLLAAFIAPLVAYVIASIVTGEWAPFRGITAGTAWSASDSWMTNVAGVAALAYTTWTQLAGGPSPLVPAKASPAILILFISFAAAAGLAPIIYASCAQQSYDKSSQNVGTVAGFLLAAAATLFAVAGELTVFWMFIAHDLPAGSAHDILITFAGVGAILIALYSVRTMVNVLISDLPKEGTTGGTEGTPGGTGDTTKDTTKRTTARSLLVPDDKRSATL